MRKELLTILLTLVLAIPFVTLALIEIVYLIDYVDSIGGALTGLIEWRSVALEGSARWPEVVGMIVGQLLILGTLLFVRRHQPDNDLDLFGRDAAHSDSARADSAQVDPPKRV